MPTPFSDLLSSYADLTSSLAEKWRAHAANVASKVERPGYKLDHAVSDLAATAALATETGYLLAAQAFEAVSVVAAPLERNVVFSEPFQSPLPGATLALEGQQLINGFGDILPASIVAIQPPQLKAGETEFVVRADATGRRAGTYVGRVTTVAAGASDHVVVWIVVP
jgi:ribosomal protein L18